jgi:hypothetical protein
VGRKKPIIYVTWNDPRSKLGHRHTETIYILWSLSESCFYCQLAFDLATLDLRPPPPQKDGITTSQVPAAAAAAAAGLWVQTGERGAQKTGIAVVVDY